MSVTKWIGGGLLAAAMFANAAWAQSSGGRSYVVSSQTSAVQEQQQAPPRPMPPSPSGCNTGCSSGGCSSGGCSSGGCGSMICEPSWGESCCGGCGGGGCGPSFTAGGEVTFLKTYSSEGAVADDLNDYQAGTRLWIGMEGCSGIGLRGRWFDYDNDRGNNGNNNDIDRVDLYTIDLELTSRMQCGCSSDLLLTGGVRYAEYLEDYGGTVRSVNNQQRVAGSVGLVVGAELNGHVNECLSLFILGRESLMFSDNYFPFRQTPDNGGLAYSITELQVGFELRRDMCCGYGFVRGAGEAQYWSGISDANGFDLGLIGGNVAVGIAR